jgi:antitoxin HigA-1
MTSSKHPGAVLRDEVLPALKLSVTEAAHQLGVSRVSLSRLLHEHAGVSADMARRLEAWLERHSGRSADEWLRLQAAHDLWLERQKPAPEVQSASVAVHS